VALKVGGFSKLRQSVPGDLDPKKTVLVRPILSSERVSHINKPTTIWQK
jgi:hypothetical protein